MHARTHTLRWALLLAVLAWGQTSSAAPYALAATPAIKIGVKNAGWIRVTQADLLAAGLEPGSDPRRFQLFLGDVEQAIYVNGEQDGHFDANDTLEFYGSGIDTAYTDTQIYWLTVGAAAGARITMATAASGTPPPTSFAYTQTFAERTNYFAALHNGEATNFFGHVVNATALAQIVPLHHIDTTANASVTVSIQGITVAQHSILVSLAGTPIGGMTFMGQTYATQSFVVPAANLVDGNNTITLQAQNGSTDVSFVAAVSITYGHTFAADANLLPVTLTGGVHLTLSNFSSTSVRIIDLSNATELIPTNYALGAIEVDVPGAVDQTLFAFETSAAIPPAFVVANQPSHISDSHLAELVVITHPSFATNVQPLVDRRRSDGWQTELVDVDDIYDEFGAGVRSAQAIKDFLDWTRIHWTLPPKYVLVVGDASVDPRNLLNKGFFDYVPTKLVDTTNIETASDDWLVDFANSGLPQMAIGRLPVDTAAQTDVIVAKLLNYPGTADLSRGGLLVADRNDNGFDFETPSIAGEAALMPTMPTERFFRGQVDANTAKAILLAKLNNGPFVVNYLGHGSVKDWDVLLTDNDIPNFTNTHFPVYVNMNCLNGFFHDVYTVSLGETLLLSPAGAIAVWASTALTPPEPQNVMDEYFLRQLTHMSLGAAATAAKGLISDPDVQRSWVLLGDPTLFGAPTYFVDADGGLVDGGGTIDARDASPASDDDGGTSADGDGGTQNLFPHAGGCGCSLMHGECGCLYPTLGILAALLLYRRRKRACNA